MGIEMPECRVCRVVMERVYGMFSVWQRQAKVYVCVNAVCAFCGVMRVCEPLTPHEERKENA